MRNIRKFETVNNCLILIAKSKRAEKLVAEICNTAGHSALYAAFRNLSKGQVIKFSLNSYINAEFFDSVAEALES